MSEDNNEKNRLDSFPPVSDAFGGSSAGFGAWSLLKEKLADIFCDNSKPDPELVEKHPLVVAARESLENPLQGSPPQQRIYYQSPPGAGGFSVTITGSVGLEDSAVEEYIDVIQKARANYAMRLYYREEQAQEGYRPPRIFTPFGM